MYKILPHLPMVDAVRAYKPKRRTTSPLTYVFPCPKDSSHENHITRAVYERDRKRIMYCGVCGERYHLGEATEAANVYQAACAGG